MELMTSVSEDKKKVIISLGDRFDFSIHQKFREAYSGFDRPNTEYVIDLSKTAYMDSSALGMILLLKDYAENHSGQVIISKPSESVHKILEIAQFHRLLKIEL